MYYSKETSQTSIKVQFSEFLQNYENSKPKRSRRGAPGGPGASWPRREGPWGPRSPSPTPLWLVTFLLLQKFLLYICPDRPDTVSRDFVCFLSRSVSARKTFSKTRCHGFPKFPRGQVRRQRHQLLPCRGEEALPDPSCGGWCPPQGRSEWTSQGREHRGA